MSRGVEVFQASLSLQWVAAENGQLNFYDIRKFEPLKLVQLLDVMRSQARDFVRDMYPWRHDNLRINNTAVSAVVLAWHVKREVTIGQA